MSGGFQVDPETLSRASTKIIESLDPVKNMDLESIPGASEAYGVGGVYEAFARFCVTWQVAATLLARQVASAGQALNVVAQRYATADDSGAQEMGQVQGRLPTIPTEG